MSQDVTTLKAFVASPSDVEDERALLEEIVRELNTTWSETFRLRIELIRWETHAYPGVADEPQEVINRQIGREFDVFIGIMWGRFGQATRRYGSGTEEEFYNAYALYKHDPDGVQIMFYFKETGISPSEIDPQQLAGIQRFKEELGHKGTLYWTFSAREEFAQLLRLHLSRVVQNWRKRQQGARTTQSQSLAAAEEGSAESAETVADEELGFLDFVEQAEDEGANLGKILDRMGEALNDIAAKMHEGTAALAAEIDPKTGYNVRAVKRVVNRTAQDMNNFSALIDAEVPLFSKSYKAAIEAITQSATHLHGFTQNRAEDIEKLLTVLDTLIAQLQTAHPNLISYRESLAKLPIATSEFRKAKKATHAAVDRLAEEFERAMTITREAHKFVQDLGSEITG